MMEGVVVGWLKAAGFSDVYAGAVSALQVAEPIVVESAGYKLGTRTRTAERGVFSLRVLVVRESAVAAGQVALAAERAVRRTTWKASDATEAMRAAGALDTWVLCGLYTTVPTFEGTDESGRAVFSFTVALNCERGNE